MLLMSLSGINFPTEKLPPFLKIISNILPLINALKASKLIINANTIFYEIVNIYIKRIIIRSYILYYCILNIKIYGKDG